MTPHPAEFQNSGDDCNSVDKDGCLTHTMWTKHTQYSAFSQQKHASHF